MDRRLWQLYAAVCDLARSHSSRELEVHYVDSGDEVEIDLTAPAARNWRSVAAVEPVRTNVRQPR